MSSTNVVAAVERPAQCDGMTKRNAPRETGTGKASPERVISPALRGFSARLRAAVEAYCQANECSQNEVARRAKVGVGTLSAAMNPEKTDVALNTALLLADLLRYNVNPYWLLTGIGPDGLKRT